MKELFIPYSPAQHILELSSGLEMALTEEGSRQRDALEVLDPRHRIYIGTYFMLLLDKTYQGLQNPSCEKRLLIFIINQGTQELIHTTKAVLAEVPVPEWAYYLTLSRAWTALDLVFEANRGVDYRDKRRVYGMWLNHFPTLVEMFEQPRLKLSGLEAEVLADMSEAAGAREFAKVFGIARDLVTTIPDTRLGKRNSRPTGLGTDFVDTVLSIRYTKPSAQTPPK